MKTVMVKAHKLAEKAFKKFGGKKSQYFAECLKLAWADFKKTKVAKGSIKTLKVVNLVKKVTIAIVSDLLTLPIDLINLVKPRKIFKTY